MSVVVIRHTAVVITAPSLAEKGVACSLIETQIPDNISYVEQQEYEGFHSSIEHSSSRPLGTRQNLLSLAHCVGTRSVITRLSALSGNMLQYGCYSSIYIESNLVHKHLHVNIHIFCFRQRDRWFKKF